MKVNTTSLTELLSLQNEDFVDAAYAAVLGRDPDKEGRAYYLARLRTGYSKLSVLFQLHGSGELSGAPRVLGLSRALIRYRMARLPLVGWLFRRMFRLEGETVQERLQRIIISELAALRTDISNLSLAAATPAHAQKSEQLAQRTAASAERRRNLVAEQLSPRAREIFDRLVSS
jgi:hypothetical protein